MYPYFSSKATISQTFPICLNLLCFALEAHYKVEKQGGFTSLPLEAGNMGLNDRRRFYLNVQKKHRRFKQIGKV